MKKRKGSLRMTVTMTVTTVLAVPLLTAAVVTVIYMREQTVVLREMIRGILTDFGYQEVPFDDTIWMCTSGNLSGQCYGHGFAIGHAQDILGHPFRLLAMFFIGFCIFIAIIVWVATGRLLRPVEEIRRQMTEITEHDLTRRVPVPRGRNEITELAATVNATLDRLEAAVEDNRRFVADASHELRSPIAALRTELEIATAYPELADWPTVVDAALADTHRLQHLATDLLLLARLDQTATAPVSDAVDLGAMLRDDTGRRRSRHAVTVDLPDHPAVVRGSRALLTQLLTNLLNNAERHATSRITIILRATDTVAVLDVADDGPGIAPQDRERIFDRFTRLDDVRTRETGGTGLGLPIARRIAAAHGGTLDAVDHHDGARFTARIPLASRESADAR
ncbi:sensor histidine kinase [Saccharothrix luteola]|uniref:sensor histidine kinase n=1 Tax=Saccharothrix luteola TaxID=2893018 RepID=UPI001E47C104|nr:HAMP domain-containing sensor histidine kinase [Saccharothrix luteola]MCC8250513.1 HAMP domain-containing histidine kinase [Saccharothrix luteola]